MADFQTADALVKVAEGGYQNSSTDAGNYTGGAIGSGNLVGTNWGISAPTYSKWIGHPATVAEMQSMPYNTSLQIRKAWYWDTMGGDSIQNQSIANMIYDAMINMGQGTTSSIVSDSLTSLGISGINTSSVFTASGINAINKADQESLFNKIKQERLNLYSAWGNLEAWVERVNKIVFSEAQAAAKKAITFATSTKGIIILGASVFFVTGIILYLIYRTDIIKDVAAAAVPLPVSNPATVKTPIL